MTSLDTTARPSATVVFRGDHAGSGGAPEGAIANNIVSSRG
jgi:hypothetical protein